MNRFSKLTALLATGLLLTGCATLPASGPTVKQGEDAPAGNFRLVDVDDRVARDLTARFALPLFSDAFGQGLANNEIIGQGDILEVSVWEAPPAVLFNAPVQSGLVMASGMATLPQQMVSNEGTITVPLMLFCRSATAVSLSITFAPLAETAGAA